MSNKVLLVIDYSNILFRSLFINQLYSTSGMKTYESETEMKSFIYKFAMDLCSIMNIFKPNNVIIATDSQHAWRKDILPGEDGYKSNRQKSENINWDNVFKCSDDLQEILQHHFINVAKCEHCEADDIAALCKELVFEKYHDYNVVIVSADADLRQLIDFNPITNQYCIVYNTTTKGRTGKRYLYAPYEFINWVNAPDSNDIFMMSYDSSKQYIKNLLQNNPIIELTEENPNNIVLEKIFCGDDGDCVPSFYEYFKNGKNTRITKAKAQKIFETIGIHNVKDLIDGENQIKPVLEKICKKEIDDIDVHERLQRQRTLVELNSNLFPADIQNYKSVISEMLQKNPIIDYNQMKAPILLKDTPYENANKKQAMDADIFKDMNKYNIGLNKLF